MYLDYANAANLRNIPSIIDGLKPVQRRLIHVASFTCGKQMEKTAKLIGACMGFSHPHGESIGGAITSLIHQSVSLLEGQGNFGGIDGSPAAAPRYTEVRLSKFALDNIVGQIKFSTMVKTYDNKGQEPKFLPCRVPLLLVNGTTLGSIGVGFSSYFPEHTLESVKEFTKEYILTGKCNIDLLELNYSKYGEFSHKAIVNKEELYHKGEGTILFVPAVYTDDSGKIIVRGIAPNTTIEQVVQKLSNKCKSVYDSSTDELEITIEKPTVEIEEIVSLLSSRISVYFRVTDEEEKVISVNINDIMEKFILYRRFIINGEIEHEMSSCIKKIDEYNSILSIKKDLKTFFHLIENQTDEQVLKSKIKVIFNLSDYQCEYILNNPIRKLTNYSIDKIKQSIEETFEYLEVVRYNADNIDDYILAEIDSI